MKDKQIIIKGRGLESGIIGIIMGTLFSAMVVVGIMEENWGLVALGALGAAMMLGIGIYGLLPKVMVIDKNMIQYFVNKEKKFEAYWTDITEIKSDSVRTTKTYTRLVVIKTKDDSLSLSDDSDFGFAKLKKIFRRLEEIAEQYPNVTVEDKKGWLRKKKK